MECGQLNVVGGTGVKTPAAVSFVSLFCMRSSLGTALINFPKPGAYQPTDPGITIDSEPFDFPPAPPQLTFYLVYWPPVTNYTIPGPAVFTC